MSRSLAQFFRLLFLAAGLSLLAFSTARSAPAQYASTRAIRPAAGAAVTTTTTLTSSSNPSTAGQRITFTVNIANSGGLPATVLTGTVTYSIDGTASGSGYVSNGYYSTYTIASLAVGSHTVTAAYSGDSNFAPSTSTTLVQVVNAQPPLYVSPSGADSNPGTQAAPKLTIQAAVNTTVSGGTVIVEDGTYTGSGDLDIDFGGKNLTVTSQNGAAATIIDCQGSPTAVHRGFYLHSGEMAVVINGLTIKNGYEVGGSGGGIYSSSSGAVSVTNCILINNTADNGAGIYNITLSGGSFSVSGCTFANNSGINGGGILNGNSGTIIVGKSTFTGNSARSGGGIYEGNSGGAGGTITINNCTFSGNMAINPGSGQGGGLYNYNAVGGGTITMQNCILTGNIASDTANRSGYGGGIYNSNYDTGGTITVSQCTLTGNTAYAGIAGDGIYTGGLGGGIYNFNQYGGTILVTNSVLTGNTANSGQSGSTGTSGQGGGILNSNSNNGMISETNCTLTGNTAPNGGGGGIFNAITYSNATTLLTNNIVYGDTGGEVAGAVVTVSYCDIQGGYLFGYLPKGEIDASPMFASASSDLHLLPGSPCIGAGTASGAPTTAIDGMMRPSPPSIGAYEVYVAPTAVTVTNASGTAGQTVTLSAALGNPGGSGLSGRTLSFSVDGVAAGAAVTNSSGIATLPYAIPAGMTAGGHALSVAFAGDTTDSASSGIGTLTVSAAGPVTATQVRFAPRVGWGSRMVGGKFQGSSDGVTYTTLATITQAPPDNQLTTLTFASPAAYRFLRYLAPNGAYGNISELEFDSGTGASAAKISGSPFGTAGSWSNQGNDFTKAFDGNISTYFDAPDPGNGDFVGIDQGSASPNQVRYFPRAGWESRMVGGQFQGSSDGINYTTLATITQAPGDAYTIVPLTVDPAAYRFLRYLAPNGAYGNIAELEFDSQGKKLTGTAFGTAGSYAGSGNDFTKVFDGNTGTYFDAPAPGSGDFVGIDQGAGVTGAGEVHFTPRAAWASRMVGGRFQGSADGVTYTDLAAIASAPPDGQQTVTTLAADPKSYRFLRYLAPDGAYGNIAEIAFYSGTGASAVKLTGTPFGPPGSWQNNGNDFTKAFDGSVSTYFDAPEPGNGDFAGIDRGAP